MPKKKSKGNIWARLSLKTKKVIVTVFGVAGTGAALVSPHTSKLTIPNLDTFGGCQFSGNADEDTEKGYQNMLKNRYDIPSAENYDVTATLENLAATNDEEAFDPLTAAEIEGWITDVKKGGKESCNCGTSIEKNMDTHIYISPEIDSPKSDSVVVEVTPRVRKIMLDQGIDWSTPNLIASLRDKRVRISGWLFYDAEHKTNAKTNPNHGKNVWRATCWEIHPVTGIELLNP